MAPRSSRSPNVRRCLFEEVPDGEQRGNMDSRLSYDSATTEPVVGDSASKEKKVRGPTLMSKVWGNSTGKRTKIEFNKLGQPIGKKRSKFAHFIGTIARNGQFMLLTFENWRKVPPDYKNDALKMLEEKFDFPLGYEDWIFKSLGKMWKNWKSTIKRDYYDPKKSIEEQIPNKPKCGRVHVDQWKELLTTWKSEQYQEVANKNKASRAKQTMIHRTGKKSFAKIVEEEKIQLGYSPPRMDLFIKCYSKKDGTAGDESSGNAMEQMRELAEKAPEGSRQNEDKENDIFAQVMGKEKAGHVRMRGLGVCPADLWGTMPSRATAYRMAMDFKTTLDKMAGQYEELSSRYDRMETMFRNGGSNGSNNGHTPINGSSEHDLSSHQNRSSEPDVSSQRQLRSSSSTAGRPRIRKNSIVSLNSIVNPDHVVAKGIVSSVDPTTKVGGVELGRNWCEVQVQVAVDWDEELIRPYGLFNIVGDTIGAPIAWPLSLVTLSDFE